MLQDLRYALRQLRRSPGFTAIAIGTLALGIGASTALFAALRVLVLDPLPYPEAGRLVHVWSGQGWPLSTPDFFDLRDEAASYAEFGVYSRMSANIGGGDRPQSVPGVNCTAGILRALGIAPLHGRVIEPADEQPGAAPVAIIAHSLWHNTFASDPTLIGRTIRINGSSVTVVGIMPASFEFASPWMRGLTCQLWTPLQLKRGDGFRGNHWLCALGRLKPGVPPGAADAEIKAIGQRLAGAYPATNTSKLFLVNSLHDEMSGPMKSGTWMLFGAVLLIQLIACANVASMLLARGALRQAELSLRSALGATRRDISRLVLCESLLLALGAALLALLVADLSVSLVAATAPATEARKAAIALGGGELLFIVAMAGLTILIAGLPSVFASTRAAITDLIRADNRTATGSPMRHRLLRSLVVAQIVIAFLLVNGAALLSSSYRNLQAANRSLATDSVLSAELSLQGNRYKDTTTRARFGDQLVEAARALPGVVCASTTSKLPLEGGQNTGILANDEAFDPTLKRPIIEISSVTPDYFESAGIQLLRGRPLQPGDSGDGLIGIVINRAFAEKYWPGKDPLGQLVRHNKETPDWAATVVGVVEDVRQWGAGSEPNPEIYWNTDRAWDRTVFLIVRSQQAADQLAESLQHAVTALDPDLPLARVRTLKQLVNDATAGFRPIVWYVNAFMALALLLVGIGLFGTLSYLTRQRTREIGIRLALGASRRSIRAIVVGQGLRWALLGAGLGIAGAFALSTLLRSMLFGIEPVNLPSLLASLVLVSAVAMLSCWLPARRATRVDPMVALRAE